MNIRNWKPVLGLTIFLVSLLAGETCAAAPSISTLSPAGGVVGATVTITGANFGASPGSVTFNGTTAAITTWNSSSIVVTVPSGATTGNVVVNAGGVASNGVNFTVTYLPSGWSDSDLGSVGVAGYAGYSNGVFTVNGAGSGFFGTSDSSNFTYQTLTGDGTIVARIVSDTSYDAYAGIMIRNTPAAGAISALVAYDNRNAPGYFYFIYRASTGGSPSYSNQLGGVTPPYWAKLVRSGNTFTPYNSLDGVNWTQTGTSQTLSMGQSVDVGLAVSSRDTSTLATATFDTVSVSSTSNPSPSITSVSATTGNVGSQVVITGTGFGASQGSSAVYLNGSAVTINSWSATSITITIPTGATSGPLSVAVAPSMNSSNPVEFAVTSNPLPTGWLDQDVGSVGLAGSATYSNNVFTVKGAGSSVDVSTSDSLHYVYQALSGSGTIVARVASVQGPSGTQAGVMIRETLDQSARNQYLCYYNPSSQTEVISSYRLSPGANPGTVSNYLTNMSLPYWLKMVRDGNFVDIYTGPDGVNWTQLGPPLGIPMQQTVYIGLGVTSRSTSTMATATFDNVSVSTTSAPAPSITSVSATSGAVGTQITITGSNFGSSQGSSNVFLNDAPVTINTWSATSITFTVPTGATSGPLVVTLAPDMIDSNPVFFSVTSQALLSGWFDQDIGRVPKAGSASYANGAFTVQGAGQVGGSSDTMHFVYQPLTTNGAIVARVTGMSSTNGFAQAGAMIRETLAANSAEIFSGIAYNSPSSYTVSLNYRTVPSGGTFQVSGSAVTLPYWVKAVRSVNMLSAFISADGVTWTQIGATQTITTAETVYVGLGVSGGNSLGLASATFDNVSITIGNTLPNPVITGITPSAGMPRSTVTINGSGFGTTQGSSVVSFSGGTASVSSWSDTQILVVVPDNAVLGPVSVVEGNITAQGPVFTPQLSVQLTDSLSNQTTYVSQVAGGQWSIVNAQGSGCSTCTSRGNIQHQYDANGHALVSVDALGNTTTNSYDSWNNLLSQTQPVNSTTTATTSYTYNSFGEVLTTTDALGNVTTNTYDSNGNLTSVTTPAPNSNTTASVTKFAYNSLGELTQITDPLNNITTLTYTPAGLIYTIKDAQNNVTTYGYDTHGNRTSVTDALNHQTTFAYDTGDRLKTITYPDTTTTTFGYDYRGRRTSVTDQNGKTTTYAYDDADRLTSVTDAANNVTTYGYDTESNLTSITDANSHKTMFTYDAFGRVTQANFPSTLTENYYYDANNNLTSKTDRKSQTIQYVYDALNRLTRKTYPDSTEADYVYDLVGKITSVNDPTGTYTFAYDNMGRLTGTTTSYSFLTGRNFTTSYSYDRASNRTGFTDPESGSTAYVYDTLNRLQTLTPPSAFTTGSFGFSYDALSRRTQMTRPNNVAANYTYDNLSRLQSVLHQLSGSTIDGASYGLDSDGNRTSKTDYYAGVTSNYTYDLIYELTGVTQGTNTTESYTYDLVGNRLSSLGVSPYSVNVSNELTSTPNATYTYDNNGNTLTKAVGTNSTTFAWDFENRLSSVTLPGSGGTVTFKYDPFGRRIYKSSSSGTSVYAYDGDDLVEETNTTGGVVARYSQGLNIDEPLAMLRSSATSYYQADGLGSVTSLSNGAGALAQNYTYDSFGNIIATTGSLVNSFRYTGREWDTETSLYYYRARYYDPQTGRFVGEDPIRFYAGDGNFYAYAFNDSTNLIDPSGLDPTLWQRLINLIFGPGSKGNSTASTCPPPSCGPDGYRDASPDEGNHFLDQAKKYKGVPYKSGGADSNGMDCSGLIMCSIQHSVNPAFPSVPRLTTGNLASSRSFRPLSPTDPMMPGDLLLFPQHVGIYDPNDSDPGMDILSARSSKGVWPGNKKMFPGDPKPFRLRLPCN
jgi:RHS repeat-associated protein